MKFISVCLHSLDIESDEPLIFAMDIGQAQIFEEQINLLPIKGLAKEELAEYLLDFYSIIIGEDVEPIELEEIEIEEVDENQDESDNEDCKKKCFRFVTCSK